MKTLVRQAKIIDPNSRRNGELADILFENNQIVSIGQDLTDDSAEIIEGEDLRISPGWVDIHAQFNDPGYEFKEDLKSGAAAASKGGFCTVAVSPETLPVIDSKADVEYINKKSLGLGVKIVPIGAATPKLKGVDFTEMFDMYSSGATCFSNGQKSFSDAELTRRILLYAKQFGGKVMEVANDESLSNGAMIHEGEVSTKLGLKGVPSLAEELIVFRDIAVAQYCDAPIHFHKISTEKSVELIRNAKEQGIKVSCDVALSNLIWTEKELLSFDTNFKVTPPLRTEDDRSALITSLNDGTIDFLVTGHMPQNIEEKECEFEYAGYGQSIIEYAYPLYLKYLSNSLSEEKWVEKIALSPAKFIGIEPTTIEENETGSFTIFTHANSTSSNHKNMVSRSKNFPEIQGEFQGKIMQIITE
ncbi:MAG TPA: dihydroorotase [Flavobacteriales bacterium]|jgi:dihydroorotase|nr:dihydroorotase [Flavobacteriales bacterium]